MGVDSDHGWIDVGSDTEELVCCGAHDQHDRASRDLRGDVHRVAGVSRETGNARTRVSTAGWDSGCDSFVAVDCVAVDEQHSGGSKSFGLGCRRWIANLFRVPTLLEVEIIMSILII